jgi:sialic acid synthase SpsE
VNFFRICGYCYSQDIEFLVSVFHTEAVALAEELRALRERSNRSSLARLKIPSGELTNLPLIQAVAQAGFPVIISTGMARLGEVEAAIETNEQNRTPGSYINHLLHCTSEYPADPAHANLRAMETLRRAFGFPVGLSDHTPGWEVAVAAVALGATMIEKHLTLDRTMEGPDHKSSLEPAEFAQMVKAIRNVEAALGDGRKRPIAEELAMANRSRKKLVAAQDIPQGSVINEAMVIRLRAEGGLDENPFS